MGSPATVASENFTVRRITVWNTASPQPVDERPQDLAAVQRAAVVHRAEQADDPQVGVEPRLHLVDRPLQQCHAAQREILALQRDDDAVGGGQRVDREQPE